MRSRVALPPTRVRPLDPLYLASILILRSRSISNTLLHTSSVNVAPGYDTAKSLDTRASDRITGNAPKGSRARKKGTHRPIRIQFRKSASLTSIFRPSAPRPRPSLRSLMNSAWICSATSGGMMRSAERARVCARKLAMPCGAGSCVAVSEAGSRPNRGMCRST